MLRTAFPDIRVTVFDTVAEGDLVAVRGEISGTHRGELMGLPPTGNGVSVSVMDFNRIASGRVHERWGQLDMLGLLQQLGAVPEAPPSADDAPADTPRRRRRTRRRPPRRRAPTRPSPAATPTWSSAATTSTRPTILGPGLVGHIAGVPGTVRGIEAYREMFGAFLAAFPDYRETIHDVVAEGDLVASRVTFGGTQRGEMFGVPATGKTVAAQGMAFLRFADSRIIELWTQADLLGLLAQLGVPLGPTNHAD